jgi:thymidylate synthase (FAD)
MSARLIAHTQPLDDGIQTLEDLVAYCARVSNPESQVANENVERLLRYMLEHGHWSPFEMVSVTLEVETTRDIARQLLRHRSFSFQEFSGRYAAVTQPPWYRKARMQHPTNRQSSLPVKSQAIAEWWDAVQLDLAARVRTYYAQALDKGIAKEVARAILPEGMTPSRLYVNGTLRSWIHYIELRTRPDTQLEHRWLARECAQALEPIFPMITQFVTEEGE